MGAKEIKELFIASHRQAAVHPSPESRAPSWMEGWLGKTNVMTLHFLSFLLPPDLCAKHGYGIEISLVPSGVSCIPSQFLVQPLSLSLFSGGAAKALALCKHSSAVTKTLLCYQPCVYHKSKTQPHACHCEESKCQKQHTDPSHS